MTTPLAIIAPQIGARSETFIRRHMEDLLPNATVVIAETDRGPYAGHWDVECPKLVLDQASSRQAGLAERAMRKLTGRLGRREPENLRLARRFLQKHHVRAILGEYLDLCLPWLPLAEQLQIPFYAHAHGYDISKQLRNPHWQKEYQKLNQATAVITMNQPSCKRLKALGIASEKLKVIPYGIDVPEQPLRRSRGETIHCLAVGRMVAKKAPILLLDAFRRAAEQCPNLKLDYIGTGELLPAVRQFIAAFDLGDRVTLHGGQPSEVVQSLMAQADIFIQHSMTDPDTGDEEGLPVAILEAMANGLPVVSTVHAGIPEAVLDGKTGFLVPEGDSRQMADKILLLSQNGDLRTQLGAAAWQRAKTHFSWQQEKTALLDLMGFSSERAAA